METSYNIFICTDSKKKKNTLIRSRDPMKNTVNVM